VLVWRSASFFFPFVFGFSSLVHNRSKLPNFFSPFPRVS
jgi:hypothetical protein